jgi:hypothetical protein
MCSKEQIEKRIEKWLNGPFDLDTKKEIKRQR